MLILAQALSDDFDAVFMDGSAHVAVADAAASVKKPVFLFRHRDPGHLERLLKARLRPGQRPLVLTDGVFPVYGRIAPVRDYAEALAPYRGLLAVDDAHGAGVLGPNGRGVTEHFGLRPGAAHVAGTLSKAFGGHGGFIVGGKRLIARVRTQGRLPRIDPGAHARRRRLGQRPRDRRLASGTPVAAEEECGARQGGAAKDRN